MGSSPRLRSLSRHPKQGASGHPLTEQEKLAAAAAAGIELCVRVSTAQQAENGSSLFTQQQRARRWLENRGIDTSGARSTSIVESARENATREEFDNLVGRVRTGETALLVVGYGNRLARNMPDGLTLATAARDAGALFVIGERVLDPRVPSDRKEILTQILDAEHENAMRTLHSSDAREELARELKYRRRMPTGLCWACPEDESYQKLAEESGLDGWYADEKLEQHKTDVEKHGLRWYVLPDPHPGVYRALSLILKWLLDTGSPKEVFHRIHTHPEYPRPGMVPRARVSTFHASLAPQWIPVRSIWLSHWLRSEALYGLYSYRSVALAKYGKSECPHVLVEDAFPSYLEREDIDRVTEIFANPERKWPKGSYTGPRNHLLPRVRCGERLKDGQICRRALLPVYLKTGRHVYTAARCRIEDAHLARVPSSIEELVRAVIERVFESDTTSEVAKVLAAQESEYQRRIDGLTADIERLDQRICGAEELESEARGKRDRKEEGRWKARRTNWLTTMEKLEQQRRTLEQEARLVASGDGGDLVQWATLASDIPRLMERCRDAESQGAGEGLQRRLIRALVKCVHVRTLSTGLYEVSVEFPSGVRLTGFIGTQRYNFSQGEQAYIRSALSHGFSPSAIACRLSDLRLKYAQRNPGGSARCAWTESMVLATDLTSAEEHSSAIPADAESFASIATRVLESPESVEAAALAGVLGTVYIASDGLLIAPTTAQIDQAFPLTAVSRIAASTGWSVDDIVPATVLAIETGESREIIVQRALRRGALIRVGSDERYVLRTAVSRDNLHESSIAPFSVWRPAPDRLRDPHLGPVLSRAVPKGACTRTGRWLRANEVLERVQVNSETLNRHAHRCDAVTESGETLRFYWFDRELVQALSTPHLHEALAADSISLPLEEFVRRSDVAHHFWKRFGKVSINPLKEAARRGDIVQVHASPTGFGVPLAYVHVPRHVWEATDSDVVFGWLHGRRSDDCG